MANTRRTRAESIDEIHARVHAKRIERLRKLIDLDFDGVISSMVGAGSKKGRRSKDDHTKEKRSRCSYISQLQSGHRPFTEVTARRIEAECKKPAGWLDGIVDDDLAEKEAASDHRVKKLREWIAESKLSDQDFIIKSEVGLRRGSLILGLLHGVRSLSLSQAEVIERELGMPTGYLDKE